MPSLSLSLPSPMTVTSIPISVGATPWRKSPLLAEQTPITLVMDNARYQRCRYVLEIAARLNIEILFLPSYSPLLLQL